MDYSNYMTNRSNNHLSQCISKKFKNRQNRTYCLTATKRHRSKRLLQHNNKSKEQRYQWQAIYNRTVPHTMNVEHAQCLIDDDGLFLFKQRKLSNCKKFRKHRHIEKKKYTKHRQAVIDQGHYWLTARPCKQQKKSRRWTVSSPAKPPEIDSLSRGSACFEGSGHIHVNEGSVSVEDTNINLQHYWGQNLRVDSRQIRNLDTRVQEGDRVFLRIKSYFGIPDKAATNVFDIVAATETERSNNSPPETSYCIDATHLLISGFIAVFERQYHFYLPADIQSMVAAFSCAHFVSNTTMSVHCGDEYKLYLVNQEHFQLRHRVQSSKHNLVIWKEPLSPNYAYSIKVRIVNQHASSKWGSLGIMSHPTQIAEFLRKTEYQGKWWDKEETQQKQFSWVERCWEGLQNGEHFGFVVRSNSDDEEKPPQWRIQQTDGSAVCHRYGDGKRKDVRKQWYLYFFFEGDASERTKIKMQMFDIWPLRREPIA